MQKEKRTILIIDIVASCGSWVFVRGRAAALRGALPLASTLVLVAPPRAAPAAGRAVTRDPVSAVSLSVLMLAVARALTSEPPASDPSDSESDARRRHADHGDATRGHHASEIS